jgi:hypothetical protein
MSNPGDISNDDGDVLLADGTIMKRGFVSMTVEQADKAYKYGWRRVGTVISREGIVCVTRPTGVAVPAPIGEH